MAVPVARRHALRGVKPPSTTRTAPVMYDAAGMGSDYAVRSIPIVVVHASSETIVTDLDVDAHPGVVDQAVDRPEGTYARACAGKAPVEIRDRLPAHTLSLFDQALSPI